MVKIIYKQVKTLKNDVFISKKKSAETRRMIYPVYTFLIAKNWVKRFRKRYKRGIAVKRMHVSIEKYKK
jgi:hypothetical protein